MTKIAFLTLVLVAVVHQTFALECYFCDTACEVANAQKKTCGTSIGASHEAICTVERPKSNEKDKSAVRRCQVVNKGNNPVCAADNTCTRCTTDLCNSAPAATFSAVAFAAVILGYVVPKFILSH